MYWQIKSNAEIWNFKIKLEFTIYLAIKMQERVLDTNAGKQLS